MICQWVRINHTVFDRSFRLFAIQNKILRQLLLEEYVAAPCRDSPISLLLGIHNACTMPCVAIQSHAGTGNWSDYGACLQQEQCSKQLLLEAVLLQAYSILIEKSHNF